MGEFTGMFALLSKDKCYIWVELKFNLLVESCYLNIDMRVAIPNAILGFSYRSEKLFVKLNNTE